MKKDWFCGIAGLGCIGLTAWMVIHDKDYWGWVLFAALLLVGAVVIENTDK